MARKAHMVRYVVEGSTDFPVDMLRYDSCHPEREIDSAAIFRSRRNHGPVRVHLLKNVSAPPKSGAYSTEPTRGRWESFGWKVISVEVVR